MTAFFINEEGEVIDTDSLIKNTNPDSDISKDLKFMTISHRNLKCVNDFSIIKSYPFVYISKIRLNYFFSNSKMHLFILYWFIVNLKTFSI
jgi:hypothetical protein